MSSSKKRISIDNINSIFEKLYGDKDLKFERNVEKTKIEYKKKIWKKNIKY